MRFLSLMIAVLLVPQAAEASRDLKSLAESTWYLHVDFERMRNSDAGAGLYAWVAKEIFKEIRKETGVELDGKLERFTAWSGKDKPPLVVMTGPFASQMEKALLARAGEALEKATHRNKVFYRSDSKKLESEDKDIDISFNGSDEVLVSFAVRNRVIVTFSETDMKRLLDGGGDVPKRALSENGLIAISADQQLLVGSAKADGLKEAGGEWQSSILGNTKQVAFSIADAGKALLVQAILEAREPELAESIGNVVRGLVGLSYFNEDMNPAVAKLLRSLQVKVDGGRLDMSVELDPVTFVSALED
ncbi:MAG: hypothetical protein AAF654_03370 [Myxococcota bacterium]